MPSTACSCIGELTPQTFTVVVADPSCRVHGDRIEVEPRPTS